MENIASYERQSVSAVTTSEKQELVRSITWKDAFWVASGVPALVLFSIGGIAALVGTPSWLCWTLSVVFGFFQAFVYAEIAGLFPGKSGGASVYGAAAWVRYSKVVAPLSLWSNWLAWTPVLTVGSSVAASYILASLFPSTSAILSAKLTLLDLNFLKEGLQIRINAVSVIATVLLLGTFAIQHRGILGTARVQTIIGVVALTPLLLIGVVPFITGDVASSHFTPFAPLSGAWDRAGWTLFFGGIYLAAWSSYAFETAVCYTREFRNPETDTFKAIFWSGILCLAAYTLVPLAFQGYLGQEGMVAPGIIDGSGVAAVMAQMVGGSGLIGNVIVVLLVLALLLGVSTSMAGSSRTLYQGSVDGWLPRYLSKVNEHGAPTRAMWTDLGFNVILLTLSDSLFVLAVSNICYLVFIFLNLQSGWIHRIDNPHIARPYRCPNWIMTIGVALAFVNAFLLGAGTNVWGEGTLMTGIIGLALILPVFWYRHNIVDKGVFPPDMLKDLHMADGTLAPPKAGWLPFGALALGLIIVFGANYYFHGGL
ncbi:amino acid permease [Agrobacterium tumefaciens]|uniref:APC family permease n=1 Tax=Agrobacterium tumefaciens TaxID=358 RepID=UPI00080FC0BE|nr:amino acid permease [Agrobacterium tumefaciens]